MLFRADAQVVDGTTTGERVDDARSQAPSVPSPKFASSHANFGIEGTLVLPEARSTTRREERTRPRANREMIGEFAILEKGAI
jgi:hypothetical protein